MTDRQIIGIGGGGFSEDPANPQLDDYILSLVSRERPAVCFVPTAAGDEETYIANFYRAFATRNCRTSDVSLFRRQGQDLRDLRLHILSQRSGAFHTGVSSREGSCCYRVELVDGAPRETRLRTVPATNASLIH